MTSVLVIDSDPLMRQALVVASETAGLSAQGFGEASAALESFQKRSAKVVLVDHTLPDMSGVEVCQRIRAMDDGELPIVIMATYRQNAAELKQALTAGADDYIIKPVDLEALMVRLAIAQTRSAVRYDRARAEARLADTLEQLRNNNAHLQTILDRLRIGCVMTDSAGVVRFVSAAARRVLGLEPSGEEGVGEPLKSWFPLAPRDMERLRDNVNAPAGERSKVTAAIRRGSHTAQLEIEIHDDPRQKDARMFLLYDLTELHDLRRQLNNQASFHDLIGKSPAMRAVYQLIQDVAPIDATVLVQGETGTGKELVARALHAASHRKNGPFIAVNCAGLTESLVSSQLFGHARGAFTGAVADRRGMFEAAHGGTLFLDEIGDIPPTVQTALLRVLQEREIIRIGEHRARKVDVRVVCATHRDLASEVETGRFRADLLYRIRVARVTLPPLRARREDIPLLAQFFLRQFRSSTGKNVAGISDEAMRSLASHEWPGNVRELKSAVEFGAIRCRSNQLRVEDLPADLYESATQAPARMSHLSRLPTPRRRRARPLGHTQAAEQNERDRILDALEQTEGNRKEAATLLGMSRATFYRRLSRLGLD